MEPNNFNIFDMDLSVDGGSLAQTVNGYEGAKFFGWVSDVHVDSMTLSADPDAEGFAFGRMIYASEEQGMVVPEPATLSLLGLGLSGLLFKRRKRIV